MAEINPLMIQYLTGLSNDLSAYGANTNAGFQPTGINKVTDANIKAQGFMKLLKQTLGPDGSSMTVGKDGIKINATNDSDLFKQILGDVGEGIKTSNDVAEPEPVAATQPSASATSAQPVQAAPVASVTSTAMPNPFTVSPMNLNIAGSNLAGLTPENIMSVIGAKQQQDQLKQQSYRDLVDSIYKGNAMKIGAAKEAREAEASPVDIKYKKALIAKAEQDTENDKPIHPVEGSKVMLNAKDWIAYQKLNKENQTPTIKNYEYAQSQGYSGSFVNFQDAAKTTHKKDYDEAVKTGYKGTFNTWLTDMAKAGAINLGDLMKKESALNDMAGENFFKDPKWLNVLDNHLKDADVKDRIDYAKAAGLGPKATKEEQQQAQRTASARERAKVKMEFIHSRIVGGGGKIVGDPTPNADGKSFTWKVRWPSGNITEITQPVR